MFKAKSEIYFSMKKLINESRVKPTSGDNKSGDVYESAAEELSPCTEN